MVAYKFWESLLLTCTTTIVGTGEVAEDFVKANPAPSVVHEFSTMLHPSSCMTESKLWSAPPPRPALEVGRETMLV